MRTVETDDYVVKFDDSQETKDKVFEAVVRFFVEHETFCGEGVCQCDGPQIAAPDFLSTLADDIIQFDVKCKGP